MLTIQGPGSQLCDGLTRREWLRIGGLGAFGLSLGEVLSARQSAAASTGGAFAKAKSCIVLFLLGAPPQHETWDPKPEAPAEIRGDLKPIQSSVPGLWVGELMPRVARLAHRCAVLRAVATGDSAHTSSGYAMHTGMPHAPLNVENAKPGAPNDWPYFGSIVKKLKKSTASLPSVVMLPENIHNDGMTQSWPGTSAGFLGQNADPWLVRCDPAAPTFDVPELTLPADVPASRFDQRRTLLDRVNRHLDQVERSGVLSHYDDQSRQAFDLLHSARARQAFNLAQEPPAVRDRYGRTTFGQSALLARRLVEAGVSLVQVNWTRVAGALNAGHWDTHNKNTEALKQLMPIMDQTYSALLEDLADRGLLEETLVIWMGEFGRTPKLNGNAGRDHWGHVFSVALAGGGVQGGSVYGASDRIGAYPREGRVEPRDLIATLFHCLGIEPHTEIHDALGRPIAASRGRVIHQVL